MKKLLFIILSTFFLLLSCSPNTYPWLSTKSVDLIESNDSFIIRLFSPSDRLWIAGAIIISFITVLSFIIPNLKSYRLKYSISYFSAVFLAVTLSILVGGIIILYVMYPEMPEQKIIENFIVNDLLKDIKSLIIAAIGIGATFIAFYVQYEFNHKQRLDIKRERAESNFMNQLNIYRDVVNKMSIEDFFKGEKVFYYHFYEFKSLYYYTNKYFENKELGANRKNILLYLAMELFLTGLKNGDGQEDGEFNNRVRKFAPDFNNVELTDLCKELGIVRHNYLFKIRDLKEKANAKHSFLYNEEGFPNIISLPFKPCRIEINQGVIRYISERLHRNKGIDIYQGHLPNLVPYFRHVAFMCKTIQSMYDGDKSTKKSELKEIATNCCGLFASQLSYHEAGLLYAFCCYQHYILNPKDKMNDDDKKKGKGNENIKEMYSVSKIISDKSDKTIMYKIIFTVLEDNYSMTFKWDDENFLDGDDSIYNKKG